MILYHALNIVLINLLLLFYENLVFREIAFLRHVNRETAFFFAVKRDPYPPFPTLSIVNIYDMVWKPFVLGDCVYLVQGHG